MNDFTEKKNKIIEKTKWYLYRQFYQHCCYYQLLAIHSSEQLEGKAVTFMLQYLLYSRERKIYGILFDVNI